MDVCVEGGWGEAVNDINSIVAAYSCIMLVHAPVIHVYIVLHFK